MKVDAHALYKTEYYPIFAVLFAFVAISNVISILYYIFNLYVTIRVKHYKNNIKILHQAIYATCPFSSAYIIIDNVCGIFEKREELRLLPPSYFMFRAFIKSPPLFALTAIMLERLCATYYVKDYEKNQRPIIPFLIIIFLIILSFIASTVFTSVGMVLYFGVCHFSFIFVCYIVSVITYRTNRRYYYNNRVDQHSYSLGERYQISENLRLYMFFSHYLFVMAVFPIICTLTIVLDSFNSNFLLREIYQIIFDLSFTLLCFLAPYLTYKMSEAWQNELHRIYVKIGLRKPNKIQSVRYSSRKLKGTFGEDINVEMN